MPEGVSSGDKVQRIASDVPHGIDEVIDIPDHRVTVVFLPDGADADLTGRNALPAFHELIEWRDGSEEQVDVVRHDDPRVVIGGGALIVHQGLFEMKPVLRIFKEARA